MIKNKNSADKYSTNWEGGHSTGSQHEVVIYVGLKLSKQNNHRMQQNIKDNLFSSTLIVVATPMTTQKNRNTTSTNSGFLYFDYVVTAIGDVAPSIRKTLSAN